MTRKMVDYSAHDFPCRSVGQQGGENSYGIADTLRSLGVDIITFKVDNGRLVEVQERLARAQEK